MLTFNCVRRSVATVLVWGVSLSLASLALLPRWPGLWHTPPRVLGTDTRNGVGWPAHSLRYNVPLTVVWNGPGSLRMESCWGGRLDHRIVWGQRPYPSPIEIDGGIFSDTIDVRNRFDRFGVYLSVEDWDSVYNNATGKQAVFSLDLNWLLAFAVALPLCRWFAGRRFRRRGGFPVLPRPPRPHEANGGRAGGRGAPLEADAGQAAHVIGGTHAAAPAARPGLILPSRAAAAIVITPILFAAATTWLVRQSPAAPHYFGPPPAPFQDDPEGGKW